MSQVVDRRYDFVFLFDVQDGNPNGDPDAGNLPRIDPQTMQGFVTDVCIKRKIRNAVAAIADGKQGFDLFFQTQDAVYEKRILNNLMEQAFDGARIDKKAFKESKGKDKSTEAEKAKKWLLQQYYDIRAFGAVLSTGDFNCGQVRGPAQITFSRSLDAIIPTESAITRKSVTTVEDAEKQTKKDGFLTGTIGRKNTVPYALYRGHGFINPLLARDTGFTYSDLAVFFQAMQRMFDLDRSASRGLMSLRGLHVFQHSTALGEAPAHVLFDKVVTPALGDGAAPRKFTDYKVTVNDSLPTGVAHRDLSAVNIPADYFPWS
ncbi:MAG: type I-C CRISPR-associated protein Cas7/Csd2 [Phycisphaerales bacterium]|nr:type I-C CRISPR-associated protein Cas7/Csd2 [Phycisphaerales bacterium]